MSRGQASRLSSAPVAAVTMPAKATMKTRPRVPAISGKACKARHNGQLASTPIHRAASQAWVRGRVESGWNQASRRLIEDMDAGDVAAAHSRV